MVAQCAIGIYVAAAQMTRPASTTSPPVAVQQCADDPGRKRGNNIRNGATMNNGHRQGAPNANPQAAAPPSASQIVAKSA